MINSFRHLRDEIWYLNGDSEYFVKYVRDDFILVK